MKQEIIRGLELLARVASIACALYVLAIFGPPALTGANSIHFTIQINQTSLDVISLSALFAISYYFAIAILDTFQDAKSRTR